MRKPVEINREQCRTLWRALRARCCELDVWVKVTGTANGVAMLKGTANLVATDTLARYRQCSLELFGEEHYTEADKAGIAYLQQFVNTQQETQEQQEYLDGCTSLVYRSTPMPLDWEPR